MKLRKEAKDNSNHSFLTALYDISFPIKKNTEFSVSEFEEKFVRFFFEWEL